MTNKIMLLIIIGLFTSCSKSLVYSSSINLTNQPIKEKEIDIQGGIELLPEARPESLEGSKTTFGLNGQLSYGFSDKFNLTIKGWADVEGREGLLRSGYALNGQFIKIISERDRIIVIPRIGIALNGSDVEGYGVGTSVIYQNTINKKLCWYGGAGLFWGFRYLEKDINSENEEKIPMGIGFIGNVGIGWQISNSFRLNWEVNPIYQINTFDGNSQILLSPSIGIGYTINKVDE